MKSTESSDIPWVNEMRLNARLWVIALGLLSAILLLTPALWKRIEHFTPGLDYRIPYPLSKDYWLYEWRLQQLAPSNIVVLGDSVVWGEYVRPDGTFSHFLNEQSRQRNAFANAGVNGLFPLAFEGLIRYHGAPLRRRKILLHCNLLWMSSPKADLQTPKEERFNHAGLVPQFVPRIPCYRADLNDRLAAVVERHWEFEQWVSHLQSAYFGQQSIPHWTLAEDSADAARYPNVYKNPLKQITFRIPDEAAADPERGPGSSRHKPWSASGSATSQFEWVDLDRSLQWAALRRLVTLLRANGNDVFAVVGPFNEHLMTSENTISFHRLRAGVAAWFAQQGLPHWVPEVLPSALYADASHPLTEGYRLLAERMVDDAAFQKWLRTNAIQ